jgi:hypothetical protein
MGQGNGLRPAQGNGQNPKQGLWQTATGLASKAVASVVECCFLVCACFSLVVLKGAGAVVDKVFLPFSAMEEAGPSVCAHPWFGRELQLEQFQL